MKIIANILKFIIICFILLLISMNIYNFINIKVLHKNYSSIFGYTTLEVVSGSMEPTIKIGDIILVDTNDKNYKVNDIVTFYDINGSFVTHRIVSIDNDQMVTKGDNNNTVDSKTNLNKIIGKYVCKVPFVGLLFASLKNPVMLTLILAIGILFCYMVSTDKYGNPKDTLNIKRVKKSLKK